MAEPTRRAVLAGLAAGALAVRAARAAPVTAWNFAFEAIEGGPLKLADYRGDVLLVTNTASFCGFTYQYKALEALFRTTEDRGFAVIGVPSQDFQQESDSNAKVKAFCDATFGVEFPMAGLTHVRGAQAHPFYAWVRQTSGGWEPEWNFNKVLIGRDGAIVGLYRSKDEPDGPVLQAALAKALQTARPAG
jgi:glutathione peroxidase